MYSRCGSPALRRAQHIAAGLLSVFAVAPRAEPDAARSVGRSEVSLSSVSTLTDDVLQSAR